MHPKRPGLCLKPALCRDGAIKQVNKDQNSKDRIGKIEYARIRRDANRDDGNINLSQRPQGVSESTRIPFSNVSWGSGKTCDGVNRGMSSNFERHHKVSNAKSNSAPEVVPSGSYSTKRRRYMCKQMSEAGCNPIHYCSPFAEMLRQDCRVIRTNFPVTDAPT